MNRETLFTVGKGIIIILILLAVVFALKAPAADLHYFDDEGKALYTDASGLPYFSEMDSYYNYRLTDDYIDHGYAGDEMKDGVFQGKRYEFSYTDHGAGNSSL
jgi:dolichyl-diphosphooligosaccharide--protein glycosyltransferase